ncbi:M48 family metallopeptidase [Shewanella sedimentimangrovi]|uniref:M48 family metallopeptidase n=1 Tax=Shewanella sedimentimangrovi TaxID=2814293 RepID=A0ABX7R3K1_9GAMM|nr:M48 family metallopeptidase [Shewanella sedimentimangrovi]QSX37736.1 M48 family metallopeptidase [Shewanella sedimentimangrovi]
MAEYSNPRLPEGINVSTENPLKDFLHLLLVTGLGLAAALFLLILASDFLVRYIPIRYEAALASKMPQLVAQSTVMEAATTETAEDRAKVQAYLDRLVGKVGSQMALPSELTPKIHYVDADLVNAFATLDGQVFIFRGLLEQVRSENALAFVIAHELGHLKLRHPIKALGRGLVVVVALSAIAGVSETALPDWLVNTSGQATLLSFSRDMELDADEEAMNAMLATYGHLAGSGELFDYLAHHDGFKVPALLSTHPAPDSRIRAINERTVLEKTTSIAEPLPEPNNSALTDMSSVCLKVNVCLPYPLLPLAAK